MMAQSSGSIMVWLITSDVCRKWLLSRCRGGGGGSVSCSHDQYDRLCLQHVNVDASATSSVFSAARPSTTTAAAAAAPTVSPDMM